MVLVDTSLANAISCVTITIVSPSFASCFITDKTSPTISGSNAEVGSSKAILPVPLQVPWRSPLSVSYHRITGVVLLLHKEPFLLFQIFHTDLGGIFLASFFHLVDTSHAVVKNRHIVKQVELLEHHSHLGTETVDCLCILRQWIAMI